MNKRIKDIVVILNAVNDLEWHDKNFLCTEKALNSMKREFIKEMLFLIEKLAI